MIPRSHHGALIVGFLAGVAASIVVGVVGATAILPTYADNAVEELARVTSSFVGAGGKQRPAQEVFGTQVQQADTLTIIAGRSYSEISSDRLKAMLRASLSKFVNSDFHDNPELAGRLDPAAQKVRACILENEGSKDAEVIECLKDVKPRFAVIGAPT